MSIPIFLRSGLTCAVLKPVGKVPSEMVRFVNLAMIAAKAPAQCLSKEVGMKSRGDDLPDNDETNFLGNRQQVEKRMSTKRLVITQRV